MLDNINKAMDYIEKALDLLDGSTEKLAESTDLDGLITRFVEVRALKDRAKEVNSTVNGIAERLASEFLPAALGRVGLTTASHRLGRVALTSRTSATILDKPQAFTWLRAHKLGELIIETVNAQTLSATAADLMERGDELPDKIFKVSIHTYASLTKPGAARKTRGEK